MVADVVSRRRDEAILVHCIGRARDVALVVRLVLPPSLPIFHAAAAMLKTKHSTNSRPMRTGEAARVLDSRCFWRFAGGGELAGRGSAGSACGCWARAGSESLAASARPDRLRKVVRRGWLRTARRPGHRARLFLSPGGAACGGHGRRKRRENDWAGVAAPARVDAYGGSMLASYEGRRRHGGLA